MFLKVAHWKGVIWFQKKKKNEEESSIRGTTCCYYGQEMKQLGSKVILMVKVLWMSGTIKEMTWETGTFMRNNYPYLFEI